MSRGQYGRQNSGVLYGERAALRQEWQHRMGRIAYQNGATDRKLHCRCSVTQGPDRPIGRLPHKVP